MMRVILIPSLTPSPSLGREGEGAVLAVTASRILYRTSLSERERRDGEVQARGGREV